MRVIAIDWSGAERGQRNAVWLAEAVEGSLIRLENGRTREEIAAHLIAEATIPRSGFSSQLARGTTYKTFVGSQRRSRTARRFAIYAAVYRALEPPG